MVPENPSTLTFVARAEHYPGEKLKEWFHQVWPAYQRWFSLAKKPTSAEQGRAQLLAYMPELVATYDTFCHTFAADEQIAAFLSLYNPPAFRAGCSQAAWAQRPLTLFRNYDFPARLCDRQLLYSRWNGTGVIAMTDCVWGVLDGMNEHGLALSLAYGGHDKRGDGFAITLVLRYILEFCRSTAEAVAALERIPVNMPYNVTILDLNGDTKTVALCPGEPPTVHHWAFATNHQQGAAKEDLEAVADSSLRESFLSTRLADPAQTRAAMLTMFMQPPLLRNAGEWHGWGTLYTSSYNIEEGLAELHWPGGQVMRQSFVHFREEMINISSPAFN